ncbi:hypothetical protein STVA_40450 [Allostella vacuolata]|nr:hypothetical protein STVA_40450 [Stella vacuolata]
MSWRQELLVLSARFAGEWPLVEPGVPVRWADDPTPPPPAAPWLRFAVVPVDARAAGFAADGRQLHRHAGLVTVDIFAPPGQGRARLLDLADRAAAVLRGWSAPGLACHAPRLALAEDGEGWARATVTVPFVRDSFF